MHQQKPLTIENINSARILPLWKEHLWPHRSDKIEATSAMNYGGGINMSLIEKVPVFLGAFRGSSLIGAISGFETDDKLFRIRGLIVLPIERSRGVGSALVKELIRIAEARGYRRFWTAPRKENISFYQRHGFSQSSEWTYELFSPGPNCYAILEIPDQNR